MQSNPWISNDDDDDDSNDAENTFASCKLSHWCAVRVLHFKMQCHKVFTIFFVFSSTIFFLSLSFCVWVFLARLLNTLSNCVYCMNCEQVIRLHCIALCCIARLVYNKKNCSNSILHNLKLTLIHSKCLCVATNENIDDYAWRFFLIMSSLLPSSKEKSIILFKLFIE